MPLVLVTGANGFIGRQVCSALELAGFSVRRGVRKRNTSLNDREVFELGEIGPETDWSGALEKVDIVIHLAGRAHILEDTATDPLQVFRRINVAGTEGLAWAAVKSGVKRFIYLSSIGAVRTFSTESLTEQSYPEPDTPYGVSKLEAELVLKRIAAMTELEVVILRPPLVYGPQAPGNFGRLLKLIQSHWPLPLGSVINLRSYIYLGNLADAIVTCVHHRRVGGQTYLVSDGEDVSTPEFIRRLAVASGKTPKIIPFPPGLLRLAGKITGRSAAVNRLLGSLLVDSSKIRRELSWRPPYSMEQGLNITCTNILKE